MSKDQIPTPHINAKYGDFADTVLLPGDPLRAKLVAETFLEDAKQVTGVRGALGFTGLYKGERVSYLSWGPAWECRPSAYTPMNFLTFMM